MNQTTLLKIVLHFGKCVIALMATVTESVHNTPTAIIAVGVQIHDLTPTNVRAKDNTVLKRVKTQFYYLHFHLMLGRG